MKRFIVIFAMIMSLLYVSACQSDSTRNTNGQSVQSNDDPVPVTLTIHPGQAGITHSNFKQQFVDPIQAEHPHISLELVEGSYEDMVMADEIPDLIAGSNATIFDVIRLEMARDLRPLIDQRGMDVSKFVPVTIEGIEEYGTDGEIYAIPFGMNVGMMLFNKDIFDRFGESYPVDGMTWNDVLQFASPLTQEEDGTQYLGMTMPPPQAMLRQYSLDVYDEENDEVLINTDGMHQVFALFEQLFHIPGYVDDNDGQLQYWFDTFMSEQRLAMLPDWFVGTTNNLATVYEEEGTIPMNWDIVSYPVYEDRPNLGRQVDFHLLMISSVTEHAEEAFDVIEVITSQDYQQTMTKAGDRGPVLDDESLQARFGQDYSFYEEKNVQGAFIHPPAPAPRNTLFNGPLYQMLNEGRERLVQDTDVSSLLRELQEEGERIVDEVHQRE